MDHVAQASWIEPDEMYSALGYPCLESSVPNLSVAVCVSRILSRTPFRLLIVPIANTAIWDHAATWVEGLCHHLVKHCACFCCFFRRRYNRELRDQI